MSQDKLHIMAIRIDEKTTSRRDRTWLMTTTKSVAVNSAWGAVVLGSEVSFD